MASRIKMTPREASLFNDMKKLAKRANQRILRLERETGIKEPFSVKQLFDKLSVDELNAVTPTGRISVKKGLTKLQMEAINKSIKNFLDEKSISTVRQARKYHKDISNKVKRDVSYSQSNAEFQANQNHTWIYQYMTESDFWNIARQAIKEAWSVETWIEKISGFIYDRTLDESLRYDLILLYQYALGVKN